MSVPFALQGEQAAARNWFAWSTTVSVFSHSTHTDFNPRVVGPFCLIGVRGVHSGVFCLHCAQIDSSGSRSTVQVSSASGRERCRQEALVPPGGADFDDRQQLSAHSATLAYGCFNRLSLPGSQFD